MLSLPFYSAIMLRTEFIRITVNKKNKVINCILTFLTFLFGRNNKIFSLANSMPHVAGTMHQYKFNRHFAYQ
jgi:hypothetical protein